MATADPLLTGITELIVSNTGITSQLPTYDSVPAVFSGLVPENAEYPYIVVSGQMESDPWDTKTELGSDETLDVYTYGENLTLVEDVARKINTLLHKTTSLSVTGYSVTLVMASGPIAVPTSEKVYGRMVTVQVKMQKV